MLEKSPRVEQLPKRPRLRGSRPSVDPLTLPVLVLNRVFQPVRITNVRRAIRLLYCGVARALDADGEYYDFAAWSGLPVRAGVDDTLAIVRGALRVPRIVHLRCYARCRRPTVRLTAANLMMRDGYRCQYCAKTRPRSALDIDHVQPRSRGGSESWTNLVTACQPCNRRKGRRTPNEASMPLIRRPAVPRWSHSAQLLAGASARYLEWDPFLMAG